MKKALLLYGSTDLGPPHFSADMLWRCGFKAPDPFPLLEIDGRVILLLSSLEIERGRKEAKADEIVSLTELISRDRLSSESQAIASFLKDREVTDLLIPRSFPYALARELEEHFIVEVKSSPFYIERARKTDNEIREIEKAQRATEHAVMKAQEYLAASRIQNNSLVIGGKVLTSESLRDIIDRDLFSSGYLGIRSIVASGIQAADPHCEGSGPIKPREPIVIDVFPLSIATHYYADQTRTFFKGEPRKEYQDMYNAVLRAQEEAIAMVRSGVNGSDIQSHVARLFNELGYYTNTASQPVEGFIHGLGHGVGLDIHESPRLGGVSEILEEGNVVTVEPGLYYVSENNHIVPGGIRIEDMVVVEKDGCRNLTQFPKSLESAIIS